MTPTIWFHILLIIISGIISGGTAPYVSKKLFGKFYKKKNVIIEPYDKQLALFSVVILLLYGVTLVIFKKQESFLDFIFSLLMIIILSVTYVYLKKRFFVKKHKKTLHDKNKNIKE